MIEDLINEEVRLRIALNAATSAEIAARNAHYEAHKALQAALIEDGGWDTGKVFEGRNGDKYRIGHAYLSHNAKQLRASCHRVLKTGKWSADARDTVILKQLEVET